MDALWPDDVAAMTALLGDDPADAAHAAVGCAGVDELLSFLDDGDAADDATSSDAHSERSHSPPPSVTAAAAAASADMAPLPPKRTRARGGSSQMKRSLETLRSEAMQLALELEQLQAHSRRTRSVAMERALAERFKRRRAESERQQLRHAVLAQQRFVRGLRSVFSSPPSFASGLNMCHYLHDYTKLPRDRAARQREYALLSDETRLRYAMDILCRETESLTVSGSADDVADDVLSPSLGDPFVQVEMVPDAGGFNVTTTSVYALERGDVAAVLRGVCIAACDLMSTCPAYPTTGIKQAIVDADGTTSAMLYRAMDVSYKSLDEQDALVVASRGLTIRKQTEREAVVVWDYVDDDELHEISPTADITRQAVGACLIRREICADGCERTVYRALSTRRYRYNARAPRDALQRYYLDSRRRMRTNELLFRDILVEAVACETAATAEAQCRRALCRP